MANSNLKLVWPATENRTVTPLRRPNSELRPREHLTEREIEKLIEAAKGNRYGQRDSTMILVAFRHGLRASELCELHWSDVEFESATLHLRRAKNGATATHPLLGDELRALRALKREAKSPFVFISERGAPFSVAGVAKHNGQASRPSCRSRRTLHAATCLWLCVSKPGHQYRTLQAYLGHRSIQSPCAMPSLRLEGSRTSGARGHASVLRSRAVDVLVPEPI